MFKKRGTIEMEIRDITPSKEGITKSSVKKNLLVYAHYYIPDIASTGQILQELLEGLLDKFNITVICVVPSYLGIIDGKYKTQKYYKENINGVKLIRVSVPEFTKTNKFSRIKNILAYFFKAIYVTFKINKTDYILSISQPPVLGGLLGVCGKWINSIKGKKTKFIYNIQDFNPEQIMAVGYNKNKFLINLMMLLDKFSCKKSDLVITVGRDLVETMEKRFKGGKNIPKTVMINNWVDENLICELPKDNTGVMDFKEKYNIKNKFVIMYSGNIGLYYDLENLIKVIEKFKKAKTSDGRDVVFTFVGDGAMRGRLYQYKVKHCIDNVVFIPYQDKKKLIYSLNAGDIFFVINSKGIKGVSCPSKYYGIAAVGKAVIGVLESGAEIRCIIEEIHGGLCSEPGDYLGLEKNIKWFIKNAGSDEVLDMGKRNRKNLVENLSKNTSIKKYANEILNL